MRVTISPGPLKGNIKAIASKSQAHRLLICAALSAGETDIVCGETSRDIEATAESLRALGAGITFQGGVFHVKPILRPVENAILDCGESGSTLRFLLPVVCALGGGAELIMHGRLPERPLSPLWEELLRHGARLERPQRDRIRVSGKISGGAYSIAGDVSSQFISGLLFALPLTGGGALELTGSVESKGYIDMTRGAMSLFGVKTSLCGEKSVLLPQTGCKYTSPGQCAVEGDWSNAAFWIVAGLLSGGGLACEGLSEASMQGDRAVIAASEKIMRGNAVIDAGDIPDLVPVLSVLAALTPGRTEFINASRLRLKESDRLSTTRTMLRALGARVEETPDGLVIVGRRALKGGVADSAGDHRIAMSAAVASVKCENEVTILHAEAVAKSYPRFFDDFCALGGKCTMEG